jgi:hypothetical protein
LVTIVLAMAMNIGESTFYNPLTLNEYPCALFVGSGHVPADFSRRA